MESGRSDADDGKCAAGDRDRLTDKLGIAAELVLPEAGAHHNHWVVILAAVEAATMRHAQLSNVEEIGRDCLAPHALRLSVANDRCRYHREVARNI
jgi:hypothetical protein